MADDVAVILDDLQRRHLHRDAHTVNVRVSDLPRDRCSSGDLNVDGLL